MPDVSGGHGSWIRSKHETDYTTAARLACPECGKRPAVRPFGDDYEALVYVACPDCEIDSWVGDYQI